MYTVDEHREGMEVWGGWVDGWTGGQMQEHAIVRGE